MILMSYEFVKAEEKYRREVLRDQNQTGSKGRAGNLVAALVVAGAFALAACGVSLEADTAAVESVTRESSAIQNDPGPSWEPDLDATTVAGLRLLAPEFGGMPAPSWQPSQKALDEALPRADTGSVNNTEPFGHPNYGRLETYLGNEPTSGSR